MMKSTENTIKQNLSKKKNKAAFVEVNYPNTHNFKYLLRHKLSIYWNSISLNSKRNLNNVIQRCKLELTKIEFRLVIVSFLEWIIDVVTEGFLINFIMCHLFGYSMTGTTIIAYGLIVTQSTSIYWRFKHGTVSKIHKTK